MSYFIGVNQRPRGFCTAGTFRPTRYASLRYQSPGYLSCPAQYETIRKRWRFFNATVSRTFTFNTEAQICSISFAAVPHASPMQDSGL